MKIKQVPEDFIVKEKINLKLEEGSYTYFKLKKTNWNTITAVKEIAKKLNTKEKFLNYAGIKDKNAITEQVISAYNISKNKLESLSIEGLDIEVIGTGKERVHTGLLVGNEFNIVIRDLDEVNEDKISFIPNYFGEQRFGINATNHLAGKAIIKKDFKKACEILNLEIINDPIATLRKNRRLLRLIFNSYQSFIFNKALGEYIKLKSKDVKEVDFPFGKLVFSDYHDEIKLPLVHFDTEFDKDLENIYNKILSEEEIKQRDFLIRQLPDLVEETQYRQAFTEVKDFSSKIEEDDLNQGKKKQMLSFTLSKGSYATIVVKFLYN
jgi:tRNA pseudouridine13 synthase